MSSFQPMPLWESNDCSKNAILFVSNCVVFIVFVGLTKEMGTKKNSPSIHPFSTAYPDLEKHFLHPGHFFQLFQVGADSFTIHPRHVISPASPWSVLGPPRTSPKYLTWEESRRHPCQMPETPQLAVFKKSSLCPKENFERPSESPEKYSSSLQN